MPYFDSDNTDSASKELMAAGFSAFGAFMATPWGTELGLSALSYGAKSAWWGVKTAGKVAKTVTPPLARGLLRTVDRGVVPVGKTVGQQVFRRGREAIGGTVKAGLSGISWVYNHPMYAPLLAGAAGAGLASFENRPAGVSMNAYNATDVMGGTSNTSQLMSEMNATGNIVFGLNNRR